MIVKTDRDGTFYVADNGNWRLAGPFSTNAEAWNWIDRHPADHTTEPTNPIRPRLHTRKPRNDTSVEASNVLRIVPLVMADARSSVNEREFSLRLEAKAKRARPLRLTAAQARWWHQIAKKYGAAAQVGRVA